MGHALNIFDNKMEQPISPRVLNTQLHFRLWKQIMYELRKSPLSFIKFIVEECHSLFLYITMCLMFVAFVVWNKGIVIDDRTVYVATFGRYSTFQLSFLYSCSHT